MDCSSLGSSFHGMLQARILERVPFPSPGDLPDPGIEPVSPALVGGVFFNRQATREAPCSSVSGMTAGLTSGGCCEEGRRRHMVSAQCVLVGIIIIPCGGCSGVGIASCPSRQPSKKVENPVCLHCYFLGE